MFKVNYKHQDGEDLTNVYQIQSSNGSIYFLIYFNNTWQWVDAQTCVPYDTKKKC